MDIQIPPLELQHELQRFASSFTERVTQGADALLRSPRADVREQALRKNLLYVSSAMEIATGPSAAINLLDMFVFVHLARNVLLDHWIPALYGAHAAELEVAFTKAEAELATIVHRALGAGGAEHLTNLNDAWLVENPGQTHVEGVRLSDFATAAGTAAADRALQARGLLSSVRVATDAANEAMEIAERSMFLFHRLPFLMRLHVRLAVRNVLDDVMQRLKTGGEIASVLRFARRTAYVAALGAATTLGLVWLRIGRSERHTP